MLVGLYIEIVGQVDMNSKDNIAHLICRNCQKWNSANSLIKKNLK